MIQDSSFERIREQVANDIEPVRPLRPAWTSALVALPIAFLLLSLVLVVYGVRNDAPQIGIWPLWGPASMMVLAAYSILFLAFVQRAPESTVSWIWWVVLPLAAIALQIGGAYWTLQHSGGPPPADIRAESMCFWRISVLGVPPVLFTLWLLAKGLPLRPKIAGLLAGLGGGFISEGVYRLHCGASHPSHVVPWHTGGRPRDGSPGAPPRPLVGTPATEAMDRGARVAFPR